MVEFIIGIFVGALLFYAFVDRKKPSGTFVIDLSDPDKDVCRLDLHEDLNSIYSKKSIMLKIKTITDNSLN